MTTFDEREISRVTAVPGTEDWADTERQILEDEVERLRQRVDDLELTVSQYRVQMSEVLGSASWRTTSPMRAAASRMRTLRARMRRVVRRLRAGSPTSTSLRIAGLAPALPLPATSPLRTATDMASLRRPAAADPVLRRLDQPRVLVVAHVHYPELWADIEDRLVRMPEDFDLLITVTERTGESAIPRIVARHPEARIVVVPNRGRDWGPMVHLANTGELAGYEVVAKVHTKRSEHRLDGDGWRLALLDGVFESPEQIRRTIDLLLEDRSVGIVVPTGQVGSEAEWGSDQAIAEALAARLPMAFDPDALRFPAGSMFWCRPWLLERLADLALERSDFESEAGQYDGTTAHGIERLIGIFAEVAGMELVETMDVAARLRSARRSQAPRPKVLAFYLPQFHQCDRNDEFWGKGFTEWTNVTKAAPLFPGHRQPMLPAESVGMYDLSEPDVLRGQAELARANGVDGFVFHHYWFDGESVLDTPLRNWLADPTIDLPLALSWANEPWTRSWDGLSENVLIEQTYSEGWADRFWDNIAPALADPRYLTVDGAPMLLVYRAGAMPNALEAIATWRRRAAEAGHPGLHLLAVASSRDVAALSADIVAAVDGVVAFPPGSQVRVESLVGRVRGIVDGQAADVLSYDIALELDDRPTSSILHPCVMPGWDNTARRGSAAYVFHGANPVTWARALRTMSARSRGGLLFVNAWNEWAEGAAIEPSARFGPSFLSAVHECLPAGGPRTQRSQS